MMGLDLQKILQLFFYDKHDRFLLDSSLFFFLFAGLLLFLFLAQNDKKLRYSLLLGFSLFFYYRSSGYLPVILVSSALVNYGIGKQLFRLSSDRLKQLWLVFGVVFDIGILGYFKYTNFFLQAIADFKHQEFLPLTILVPIGISYFTFKVLSYLFDIYYGSIEEQYSFSDFLLYVLFFPAVMIGPIDKARNFLPQVNADYALSREDIGHGFFRIMLGLLKKVVIADYIWVVFNPILDSPEKYTGVEILIAIYAVAIKLYCEFSGYTDIGIGIARLMGFRLTENFNFPYKAKSVAEFWRRWHMSLSGWIQEYLFTPLQMSMRNLKLAGNILAVLIAFILCGMWHGASWNFIIWGGLHGAFMGFALLIKKPKEQLYRLTGFSRITKTKFWGAVQIIFTFHLIGFAWIFFNTPNLESVGKIYAQMTTFFKPVVFSQFIAAYPQVIIVLVLGYVLHFTPNFLYEKLEALIAKSPLIIQAELFAIVIWIITQFRFADSFPPTYFNF
jgi:D-alanyl-lipoteichoic acid acyltransferase DltB (MBOAT superfamily)